MMNDKKIITRAQNSSNTMFSLRLPFMKHFQGKNLLGMYNNVNDR